MAFLRKESNSTGETIWKIYYRTGKRQKSKVIGRTDKRTAEQIFIKFCNDLAKGEFGIQKVKNVTVEEFLYNYWPIAETEKAPGTVTRERYVLKPFIQIFGKNLMEQILVKDLTTYRSARLKEISKVTINIEFRHLKSIFNTAKKLGYLRKNPFKEIKLLRIPENDKIRFLELDAIERVREAFENDEMCDLVEFYLLTGTRIMEPLSLTWDDVDNKREQIIIRALNTKAKRNRVIVFKKDAKLKKLIKSLPKRKDNLLFGQTGRDGQRSRYSVYNKIKRILVELEYPWASPHTFRHTFISHLVMAGVPLTTVQKLVGHADFSTTLKYAHLASDHTDEMISKRPF